MSRLRFFDYLVLAALGAYGPNCGTPPALRSEAAALADRPVQLSRLPPVSVERLANGLLVYSVRLSRSERMAAMAAGPRGSDSYPADALALRIAREALLLPPAQGFQVDVSLDESMVGLGFSTTEASRFRDGLEALFDTCRSLKIRKEHYHKNRARYFESLREAENDVRTLALSMFRSGRYGAGHPWAIERRASPETLERVGVAELDRAWNGQFPPERSALILVGPMDLLPSPEFVEDIFGRLPASEKKVPPAPVPPLRLRRGLEIYARWYVMDNAYFQIGHVGPGLRKSNALAAFEILTQVFERPPYLVGDVSRFYVRGPMSELFWGGAVAPKKLSQAIGRHRSNIERIQAGKLSAVELETARARVLHETLTAWSDPEWIAWSLAGAAIRRRPECSKERLGCLRFDPNHRLEALAKVTRDDVVQAARAFLHPYRLDVALIGPPELFRSLVLRSRVTSYFDDG